MTKECNWPVITEPISMTDFDLNLPENEWLRPYLEDYESLQYVLRSLTNDCLH